MVPETRHSARATQIRFACPHCEQTDLQSLGAQETTLGCAHCQAEWAIPSGAIKDGRVLRCVVCPSQELFLRKDFPQRLGLTIVVAGFTVSCITWYYHQVLLTFLVLFAAALVDVILYTLVSNVLTCYRCHAEYRGTQESDHVEFNLEVHERHRQQRARLKEQPDESESRNDRSRSEGSA